MTRARADGRVRKKARFFRVTFIVTVLMVVGLLRGVKNGEIYLRVGVKVRIVLTEEGTGRRSAIKLLVRPPQSAVLHGP